MVRRTAALDAQDPGGGAQLSEAREDPIDQHGIAGDGRGEPGSPALGGRTGDFEGALGGRLAFDDAAYGVGMPSCGTAGRSALMIQYLANLAQGLSRCA